MKPVAFEIRKRKLDGSPHSSHSIFLDGKCIRSQLAPYSPGEAEGYIAAHLNPLPSTFAAPFHPAKRGPKPKNTRGGWVDGDTPL